MPPPQPDLPELFCSAKPNASWPVALARPFLLDELVCYGESANLPLACWLDRQMNAAALNLLARVKHLAEGPTGVSG